MAASVRKVSAAVWRGGGSTGAGSTFAEHACPGPVSTNRGPALLPVRGRRCRQPLGGFFSREEPCGSE